MRGIVSSANTALYNGVIPLNLGGFLQGQIVNLPSETSKMAVPQNGSLMSGDNEAQRFLINPIISQNNNFSLKTLS